MPLAQLYIAAGRDDAKKKVLIEKVVKEEETAFYKTLEFGLKRIDQVCIDLTNSKKGTVIDGKVVYELYDTFGFPLDLTQLIAKSYDLSVDETGFAKAVEPCPQATSGPGLPSAT